MQLRILGGWASDHRHGPAVGTARDDCVRPRGDLKRSLSDLPNEVERAALVAALSTTFSPADAPLVRGLTRQEIAWVEKDDAGCGDVLLASCWMLFVSGDVEDAALIWHAKNVYFDAHCYIDSVFLVPQGVAATAEFARSRGLRDLATWVGDMSMSDLQSTAEAWRSGEFFAEAPPATASVEELAAWIRQ